MLKVNLEDFNYVKEKYEQRKLELPESIKIVQPKLNINNSIQLLKQVNKASKSMDKEISQAMNFNLDISEIQHLKSAKKAIKQYRIELLQIL